MLERAEQGKFFAKGLMEKLSEVITVQPLQLSFGVFESTA